MVSAPVGGGRSLTTGGSGGYVAEKSESEKGWLFPVGDEVSELGYVDMFADMFDSMEAGREPRESFYDGYVVNAIMDACYRWDEAGGGVPDYTLCDTCASVIEEGIGLVDHASE